MLFTNSHTQTIFTYTTRFSHTQRDYHRHISDVHERNRDFDERKYVFDEWTSERVKEG